MPPVRTIVLDRPPTPVVCRARARGGSQAGLRGRARAPEPARREHRLRRQGGRQIRVAVDPPGRGAGADRAVRLLGKTTLLRTLNRLTELTASASRSGEVLLDGEDIHDLVDTTLRSRVAMVFQQPNPFPMSIFDNVAFALREQARKRPRRRELEPLVIDALRQGRPLRRGPRRPRPPGAAPVRWPAAAPCIARAIAPRPEVLLMDEPCSALDPISTGVIENLIGELRRDLAVVIVTHNLAQAIRGVGDKVAFMYLGDLVEYGTADDVFEDPRAAANTRLRARSLWMSAAARPARTARCDAWGRGLWLTNLAPVPCDGELSTCVELLGPARGRLGPPPVLRSAVLARSARVPRRARDRAPAAGSAPGCDEHDARRLHALHRTRGGPRAGCAATRRCSACCRCCCSR